jgi:hypothetical protein
MPHTHKVYILRHCINILFILQKHVIIQQRKYLFVEYESTSCLFFCQDPVNYFTMISTMRKKTYIYTEKGVMVFNATFNNISVISWRSVILVEETGVPGESHQPVASHWQTLSHNVVFEYRIQLIILLWYLQWGKKRTYIHLYIISNYSKAKLMLRKKKFQES